MTPLIDVILGGKVDIMDALLLYIDKNIAEERDHATRLKRLRYRRFNSMCATIAGRLGEVGFGNCLAISGYYVKNIGFCAPLEDIYNSLHEKIQAALLDEQRNRYGCTFDELRDLANGVDDLIDLKVVEVDRDGHLNEPDIPDPASFFSSISQDSHYFILVDSLSKETIKFLRTSLHVPPIVFLRHISGGGFIEHQISETGNYKRYCPNNCNHTKEFRKRETSLAVRAAQESGYSVTWRRLSELDQEGYKQERRALCSCRRFERSAAENIVPNLERLRNGDDRTGYVMSRVYGGHHLLDNYRRRGIWLIHLTVPGVNIVQGPGLPLRKKG